MERDHILPGNMKIEGADAEYFVSAGVEVPTVYDVAWAENSLRDQYKRGAGVFPPGSPTFDALVLNATLIQQDPTHGLHSDESGIR